MDEVSGIHRTNLLILRIPLDLLRRLIDLPVHLDRIEDHLHPQQLVHVGLALLAPFFFVDGGFGGVEVHQLRLYNPPDSFLLLQLLTLDYQALP